jgi:hypothetical protein
MISTINNLSIATTAHAAPAGRKTAAQAGSDPFSALFSGKVAAAAKSQAASPMAASPFGAPARSEVRLDPNLSRVFQTENASAVR